MSDLTEKLEQLKERLQRHDRELILLEFNYVGYKGKEPEFRPTGQHRVIIMGRIRDPYLIIEPPKSREYKYLRHIRPNDLQIPIAPELLMFAKYSMIINGHERITEGTIPRSLESQLSEKPINDSLGAFYFEGFTKEAIVKEIERTCGDLIGVGPTRLYIGDLEVRRYFSDESGHLYFEAIDDKKTTYQRA